MLEPVANWNAGRLTIADLLLKGKEIQPWVLRT